MRPLHPSSTNEPLPFIRTMLSQSTIALDIEHLDIFFDRYDEYTNTKLDDASLLRILGEHDNPLHMVNKYHQHGTFADFLEHCDFRAAGLLFPSLAIDGWLPADYMWFLRWLKFDDPTRCWKGKTRQEKGALLAQYRRAIVATSSQ